MKKLLGLLSLLLLSYASHLLAGSVITTNLPTGTAIVNINAQADGIATYSTDPYYSFFYQPTASAPSITLPAGTYRFSIIDPADAAKAFPALTPDQLLQVYTGWTFNSPWSENYLVFGSGALTNPNGTQLFDGAIAPGIPNNNTFSSAQAAYDGTVASGYANKVRPAPPGRAGDASSYLTEYTLNEPTTLLFVIPDYYLPDNTGGVSVVVQKVSSPSFFTGETALSNGVYYLAFPNGNIFGYYSYLSDPHYIYHFDLGYEYVFDAADGHAGVYLYDFKSSTFFYTSPTFPFPYLYDFSLNTVLYYYPDPNNPGRYNTNGVRYFYRFDTGQIITK